MTFSPLHIPAALLTSRLPPGYELTLLHRCKMKYRPLISPCKWIHLGRRGHRWRLYTPPGTRCRRGRPGPGWSESSPGGRTHAGQCALVWAIKVVNICEAGLGSDSEKDGVCVCSHNKWYSKTLLTEVNGSSRQGVPVELRDGWLIRHCTRCLLA